MLLLLLLLLVPLLAAVCMILPVPVVVFFGQSDVVAELKEPTVGMWHLILLLLLLLLNGRHGGRDDIMHHKAVADERWRRVGRCCRHGCRRDGETLSYIRCGGRLSHCRSRSSSSASIYSNSSCGLDGVADLRRCLFRHNAFGIFRRGSRQLQRHLDAEEDFVIAPMPRCHREDGGRGGSGRGG